MQLKPLHAYVVVKPLSDETVTKAGLVLPETVSKERSEKGEVIACGPGKLLDNGSRAPMSVQTGQKVMFKKYSPDEIKIDGEDYLVIREEDIMLIIS